MLKSLDLAGRVAVVIGGTSGIGRTLALGLAEAGADVVATGRRENLVAEVAAEIESMGRKSLSVAVDVLNRASVDQLRDAVMKHFGHVDILLNAAGKIGRKPTVTFPEAEWDETFNVNVTGALRACQAFYEPLKASGHGRIINIVSLNSYVSLREVAAYAASKSALLALTRSLAVEWSRRRNQRQRYRARRVFRTDLNKNLLDSTDRGKELLSAHSRMKRFGQDSANSNGAGVLLASDAGELHHWPACIIVDVRIPGIGSQQLASEPRQLYRQGAAMFRLFCAAFCSRCMLSPSKSRPSNSIPSLRTLSASPPPAPAFAPKRKWSEA